jgi:uncharacterized delta-60 repeat protein
MEEIARSVAAQLWHILKFTCPIFGAMNWVTSMTFAAVPVSEAWVARYNTFVSREDIASAMVIDSAGNIYVTGYTHIDNRNSDIITIKYDGNGDLIWTARYNSGHNSLDFGQDIAIDMQGNAYIAAGSRTIKYDPEGNQRWIVRHQGPGSSNDRINAVTVDASGNVFLTGYRPRESGLGYDIVTQKYDTDGNQLWVARYGGPDDTKDRARVIATDGMGNIIVAGQSDDDFITIKYDSAGNQLWVARYDGGSFDNGANDIAVNALGEIYVAGSGYGETWLSDMIAIKYDADGNELWVSWYDGASGKADEASAIAVDFSGNVYICGYVTSASGADIVTIKLNPSGSRLWIGQTSGGMGIGRKLSVDHSGNVYVAGFIIGGGVDSAITTLKYDSQGNPLWVDHYPGYGNVAGLAIESDGNVLTVGSNRVRSQFVDGYEDWDIVTLKYDPDGNRIWSESHAEASSSYDKAVAMALDHSGNTYVTGNSSADVDLGSISDIVVVKYDIQGNLVWAARYDEPAGSYEMAVDLSIDASGNSYVLGLSIGEGSHNIGGNHNIITIKFDSSGNRLWSVLYDGLDNGPDDPADLAVDDAGNVYVTGSSMFADHTTDIVAAKYDTNGNQIWLNLYNGTANGNDDGAAIAVGFDGCAYVTGTSYGGESDYDIVTIKYDAAGNQLWMERFDSPTNRRDGSKAIALDAAGNIYVLCYTGIIPIGPYHPELLLLKYSSAGDLIWRTSYKGSNSRDEYPVSLVLDGLGNAYVNGTSVYSSDGTGIVTLMYDRDGNLVWSESSSGLESRGARATGLAMDASGNQLYVAGTSDGGGTGTEILAIAYNTAGGLLWMTGYNGPYNEDDSSGDIAVDSSGNIIVIGDSVGIGTGSDFVTIKYLNPEQQGSANKGDTGTVNCFLTSLF